MKQSRRTADAMNRRALNLYKSLGRTPRVVEHRDWGDLRRTYPNEPLLPWKFPAECGTTSGYHRHRRNGEDVCRACADAHTRDVQARKAAA